MFAACDVFIVVFPFARVLPPLAGKKLYLATAAASLLCLLVVLYFTLRKHRQNKARAVFGRAASPLINTSSALDNTYGENHTEVQLRELDPSVNTSPSDCMYATVTRCRVPDEENICSVSSPSTDAGDRHIGEDLLYARVCFNTNAAQPESQIRSAAEPSELYATVKCSKT